jgi:GAF domain-containing protein
MLGPLPSFVADLARSGGFPIGTRGVIQMGPGAAACVLLLAEGRTVGLIYLGGRKRESRLAPFEVEMLEALGAHAALVLAGFRLSGRIHRLLRVLGDAGAAPGHVSAEVRRRLAIVVPKRDDAPVDEGRSGAV